jgi:hypothetical protein
MDDGIRIIADLPTGSDGRNTVSIVITEIAAYESHIVTSYSYEDWTKITLKNGVVYDCRIAYRDFVNRLKAAAEAP